jgi:hypothetical protein
MVGLKINVMNHYPISRYVQHKYTKGIKKNTFIRDSEPAGEPNLIRQDRNLNGDGSLILGAISFPFRIQKEGGLRAYYIGIPVFKIAVLIAV